MNSMNCIAKIWVRSIEELNSNQNLLITSEEFKSETNFIEKDSGCGNILTGVQSSQSKLDECTAELQEGSFLSSKATAIQTETNCVSPILEAIQPNTKQKSNVQSNEELSGESCFIEKDQVDFGNVCLDLEEEKSQNSQHLSKNNKAFSESLNIEHLKEKLSPVFVESNNGTDVKTEPPDDSFCLMEFVETVFGVGCNGENLNCLCAPIQLEIEGEEPPETADVSRNHDYSIECEIPEFEQGTNNERISVQSKSKNFNIDEKTYSRPFPQITEPLLDSERENIYKPTMKSPDKVPLNQIVSPYHKGIAGTTFVVDDFRYGTIADATAIFLTHFHSDQYNNLKGNLSKPTYLSRTTARLLRQLTSPNESMLHVMDLNNTIMVDGVKVTALDANYCPGAIMLLFQLSCGFRILYTGDFHASSEMELPFLKAGKIDLLYLDMAYISRKNNLSLRKVSCQSQEKNISDAIILIRKFKQDHVDNRILFVFGHNVLGNEELWLQIADTFDFKVWTDEFRVKILTAIGNEEYIQRLVPNPNQADMHLIQYSNISNHAINEYWKGFKDAYDVVFAIKPNQWVDNKRRPPYKGEINIAEIEYSGHSNETEIRRFLAFLQPKRVITIVPAGKDHKMYAEVPLSWYKQKWFSPVMKQASMFDFFQAKQKK